MFRFLNDPLVRASARESQKRLWVAMAAMAGRGLLGLAVPFFLGRSLDIIVAGTGYGPLFTHVVLLLVFAVGTALCQWWMRWLWIGWSRDAEQRVRDGLLGHILTLPLGFFQRSRIGDLMSRLTSDVEAVRMGYGPGVMHCTHPIFMTLGALALMLWTSPPLTAVAMAPMVLLFLAMKAILPTIHTRSLRVQERQGEISTRAQESFSGARVIKAFAREDFEEERFSRLSQDFLRDSLAHARQRGLFQGLIEVFAGLGGLVLFWVAGGLVIEGTLTVGDYMAFSGYLNLLVWPMIALGWTLSLFQRAEAAESRLNSIRAEPPEQRDGQGRTVLNPTIESRDLTFRYPDTDRPVLQGVSFRVDAGKTLGIVGPTGCGKSTLINLILRLHEPPEGKLFVGNRDVTTIPMADLRAAMGVVPQESFLFSRTIRENLLFGMADATDEALKLAVYRAGLDEDLRSFPKGIDTVVGERGITLSGGQRQRTALARALLREAPVLLLDDALSSVDTETEQRILSRLRPYMAARTAIVVSHRLSSVQGADEILVLEEGRVIERGRHEDLLKQQGAYLRLWTLQQAEAELGQL